MRANCNCVRTRIFDFLFSARALLLILCNLGKVGIAKRVYQGESGESHGMRVSPEPIVRAARLNLNRRESDRLLFKFVEPLLI